MTHKPSKLATVTKFFSGVLIIGTNFFDECFLFHVLIARCYSLEKFIITLWFHVVVFFETNVSNNVLFLCYLHNSNVKLLYIILVKYS